MIKKITDYLANIFDDKHVTKFAEKILEQSGLSKVLRNRLGNVWIHILRSASVKKVSLYVLFQNS